MLTTPTAMVNYMDSHSPAQQYSQDFTEADLTGLELVDGGDYTLVTVGIDAYGVQDGVCRANFTAPAIPVAGDPQGYRHPEKKPPRPRSPWSSRPTQT